VRDIDQEQARPVPGATGVYQVFWSADSRFIGYSAGRDLLKIPLVGGAPVLITKLAGDFRRAAWSSDGETIVYCDTTGLYTVPATGGASTHILEHTHIEHPSFLDLPNGRRALLYQALDPGPNAGPGHGIYVQALGEERRRLVAMTSSINPYPAYSSGHIVYVDGSGDTVAIWALPFSLATLQPAGKAFPIAQRGSSPQVSRTGTLVYSDAPSDRMQLIWCDRSGRTLSTLGEPQVQDGMTLSPDGRRVAVQIRDRDWDIWVYDLERGIKTRFTSDAAAEQLGAWSPSGDEIVYASNRNGNFDIFSRPSNGNGEPRLLVGTPLNERSPDWSPGRQYLIYAAFSPGTRHDLLYRERRPDGTLGDPVVFLQTPSDEGNPRFSPDGRYVAYMSDESGQFEVYVRSFPSGAQRWQISASGGVLPRWRRDGKEIFYLERGRLLTVSVTTQPAFSPGAPAPLFVQAGAVPPAPSARFTGSYDVSPDGKRFLVRQRPPNEPPLAIHVVHNWFEEFRGRQDQAK
jgi:Tol biopolymer transport system component